MTTASLLELTGAVDAAALAAGWPHHRIRPEREGDYDVAGATRLIDHLDMVLAFDNVRTAVAPDGLGAAVSVTADVHVDVDKDPRGRLGAVHRNLPDFVLQLAEMDTSLPARLVWTRFGDGTSEVIVLGLPVKLHLPLDLLTAPFDLALDNNGFDTTRPDSLGVRLETGDRPSVLTVFASVRVTRTGEVIIVPNVPLAIGFCVFMGLPCRAVHDIAFVPDVLHVPPSRVRELPVGWAQPTGAAPEDVIGHSVLAARLAGDAGLVTIRTIELNRHDDNVKQVYDFLSTNVGATNRSLEIPIEDVALAFDPEGGFPTPAYPLFGLTGLRRAVNDDTAAAEPFDHRLTPIILPIRDWLYVHLHRLLLGWTDEPVVAFDMAITRSISQPDVRAVTVNFTQDFVLRIGWVPAEPKRIFSVGNADMSLLAVRAGVNFGVMYGPHAEPDPGFKQIAEGLLDLGIVGRGNAADGDDLVQFTTRSGGRVDVVLRDVGWKANAPSVSVWVPEGVDMSFLGRRGFHIDEIGLATTTHGASYVRLSASYRLAEETPVAAPESQMHPPGSGIWVRGLRIRVAEPDDVNAPPVAIDGIVLAIRAGRFEIEGGGWLRDEVAGGSRLREIGFGLRIIAPMGATEFILSGLLVSGSVESSNERIEYLLAGVTFGPIPLGSFQLTKGTVLVARNYLPRLPEPTGVEQNLRMLHWYRSQPTGLELPPSRVLGAWEPTPDSWAVGVALRLGLGNSAKIKLDGFGLWLKSPEDWSLLIGLELRWEDRPNPIGWLAVEYDDGSGRWAATGGIALGIKDVLKIERLPAVVQVTGAVYVSNEPRTVALGHIEDVDSWLQFKVSYDRFDLLLRVGLCFYDYAGDPPMNALGFVVTGRGRTEIAKLTEFSFLLEVIIRLGSFSSNGPAAGIIASIEAALRIKVWRLSFGLRSRIVLENIHPEPESGRITVDFAIETPWFLPDIHVSHTWPLGDDPAIESARVVSLPVRGGRALAAAGGDAVDLAAPLPAGADDAGRPYSIGELAALAAPDPGDDVFATLTPVAVDSVIAVDFAAAVTDQLGTGETTPMAASKQANGELYCDYEVLELGIRRRPRYGGGTWTTLVDPQSTSTAAIDPVNSTVDELVASFTSQVSMRWDRDNIRAGKLDARRLLVNSATPFTLASANPIADEALLEDTDATCCGRKRPRPWVRLDFETNALGVRLQPVTSFPGNAAHVRWHGLLGPVVTEAQGTRWARIPLTGRAGHALATVRFDRLTSRALIRVAWSAPAPAVVRFELHRGLHRVAFRDLPLGAQQSQTIEVTDGAGADQLVIRLLNGSGPLGALYFDTLAYVDREHEIRWLMGLVHCDAGGTLAGGTLSWLHNHDYEIAVTCRATVGHDRVGSTATPVQQTVLFRTKGLPGLNAADTPGGDLAPFVESEYPARTSQLLYRDEPILLVMNERFAPLAPAVDAPQTAPPERRQLLQWSMLVDEVGSGASGTVATYASPDWLSAHRPQPGPLGPPGARGDAIKSHVRHATSLDTRLIRLDGVRLSPANCQPHELTLHDSRIYSCEAPDGGWAHAAYRARVVRRGGPYVLRDVFEAADLSALTMTADGGPAGGWAVDGGALVAPSGVERAWAVLGDASWLHMEIRVDVDAEAGRAGLALAVNGGDAWVAVVDASTNRLCLERRQAGVHHVVEEAELPAVAGPVQLDLVGYDDAVLARVGQVEVRASRGDTREGRVALVGSAGARFTRFAVEPVEAYAINLSTSRWRSFDAHVDAHRDVAPMTIGASRADVSAWVSGQWDAIHAVMTPDADPRTRAGVFRSAVETLGIAAIEEPSTPLVTVLRAEGAGVGLLVEGPEPVPAAHDVKIRLQRRRRRPPFGDVHPPLDSSVLVTSRREIPGRAAVDRLDIDLDLEVGHDRDLFPVDPVQWIDIDTLVLTDATERAVLILPVDPMSRTVSTPPSSVLRVLFELDRERYRSSVVDPQSRYRTTVTRMVYW